MHLIPLLALAVASAPTPSSDDLCGFLRKQGTITEKSALAILSNCPDQAEQKIIETPNLAVTFRVDGSVNLLAAAGRGVWYDPNHPERDAYVQVAYRAVKLPSDVEKLLPFIDPFDPALKLPLEGPQHLPNPFEGTTDIPLEL
jgi:hypothetical protein